MKSKEEVLISHYKSIQCDSKGNPGHLREDILPAMDEYAKELSIGFAEFIVANGYKNSQVIGLEGQYFDSRNHIAKYFSLEELFNLYLQTIK